MKMQIMLVHHLMMLLVLLLFTCHESSTAASTPEGNTDLPMARSGCNTTCGNVTIPYPFGMGSDTSCYYDEWYRIDCNDSKEGYLMPLLAKAKLEVLNISMINYTVTVNNPVTFFCEQTNGSKPAVDLKDTPFFYSQSRNIFTAVSCGDFALVSSAAASAEFLIAGGCRSSCGSESSYLNCDIGVNCCQTSIPPYLTSIAADLYDKTRVEDCSKFAFLVQKDWSDIKPYSSTLSAFKAAIKRTRKVPVALNWRINNDTRPLDFFNKFIVDIFQYLDDIEIGNTNDSAYGPYGLYNNLTTSRSPWDPSCYISDSPGFNRSEIFCSCRWGFEGNPFLGEKSCRDIDECKDSRRCYGRKCVNDVYDIGQYNGDGYHCEDEKREDEKSEDESTRNTKLILAIGLSSSLGLLLLLIAAWFGYKFVKRRNEIKRKKIFFKRNGGLLLEQELLSGTVNVDKIKLFKSRELEKSTDNFNTDRILGQGGQGTVYKGMLEDGKIVAVKKSKVVDESQLSEFINEIVILSQLNHRNIVQVLGCCLETEVPILVYEFIPNGTLSGYIAEQIEEFPLTWKIRLRIATEIAGALSHLHYTASFPIYHRDIKSTNILLDEKYRAKVADFGTSRSIAIDQTHLTTSLVHGTFGYLDPEYFQSSQFTEKSDVYSFGVVLVELLTGQKPISLQRSENEGKSLATYFIISMQKDCLFEIVDPQVLKDGPKEDILAVANLARRCLNLSGRKRPTMREVMTELEGIQKTEKSSGVEQNHEEVEYLRTDLVEPWDITSSSSGTGAGRISSFMEIPLLSFKSV